ncbi:hypothetical protein HMPREF0204_14085 [Chryseobacterium gleum ATCC 35910]|uniref:Uncharacterized protein n=1 Tax=Chryseobacterium gleum ATCC 35910 TaxID=525257 RepID=A0ABN0APJ4_CHRGE|nr:hypothetical protein HMPREF0204_14085 [Chryseobacterium gleum ATCC 35910]
MDPAHNVHSFISLNRSLYSFLKIKPTGKKPVDKKTKIDMDMI